MSSFSPNDSSPVLRIGDVLYGFCGGSFGRDSYMDKRVEALGADWVVARPVDDYAREGVQFYVGNPEDLIEYRTPDPSNY